MASRQMARNTDVESDYNHHEYYLVKLHDTVVYVENSGNLSRTGSEHRAEIVWEKSKIFSNNWASGISGILPMSLKF